MKKLLSILLIFLLLVGCSDEKVSLSDGYQPVTYTIDMSGYEGMSAYDHAFKGTTVSELQRLIDNKGNGIFVLSRTGCEHCQEAIQYLNEVLEENDLFIYYIDCESTLYPIIDTPNYDTLYNILYDYLNEGDTGEKVIRTPHVFTIVNGEIKDSKIGTTWTVEDYDESDVEELENLYSKMFNNFTR